MAIWPITHNYMVSPILSGSLRHQIERTTTVVDVRHAMPYRMGQLTGNRLERRTGLVLFCMGGSFQ